MSVGEKLLEENLNAVLKTKATIFSPAGRGQRDGLPTHAISWSPSAYISRMQDTFITQLL